MTETRISLDLDEDGNRYVYHPIASTNLGAGWRKGEERPRVALIARADVPGVNGEALNGTVNRLEEGLCHAYPGIKLIDVKAATPDRIQDGLQQMQAFAKAHPGAESLIFMGSHGVARSVDPRSPIDAVNGGLEGILCLPSSTAKSDADPFFAESTMKDWCARYLRDFSTNLLMVWSCHAGAWIA